MANSNPKPPNAGKGRPKGIPNKTTALLKDAILRAAEAASPGGMVGYLTKQAQENPGPFMALLGKVLPMQLTGADGGPIKTEDVSARAILADRIAVLAARNAEDGDISGPH